MLKELWMIDFARERSRLVPLKAISTGKAAPNASAIIQIPGATTLSFTKRMSIALVTVLNLLVFFDNLSCCLILLEKHLLISVNFVTGL